jgi:hypothetical protein
MRLGQADSRQSRPLINDAGKYLPQGELPSDIRAQRRFDP